ncbi:hypothetical protein M405DRAFT_406942 [Rhizopogon salebrosus TDB-379]|nr:hypothetical protein M405DRAFT_406942 [Rhizopogon salebrosus TDB-379]
MMHFTWRPPILCKISMSLKKNVPPYSFSRNAPFDVKNFQWAQIGGHVEEEHIQHRERVLQCLEYVYGTFTCENLTCI